MPSKQYIWQLKQRAKGCCTQCGLPAGTRTVKSTGEVKPRVKCAVCAAIDSARQLMKYHRRKTNAAKNA